VDEASLQLNLGCVESRWGKLSFSFVVRSSGDAHLQIYGYDPSDLRKSGVLLNLNESEYQKLKELIEKTDQTIEKLRGSGQFKTMLASYR
jgi:hypothetical protein